MKGIALAAVVAACGSIAFSAVAWGLLRHDMDALTNPEEGAWWCQTTGSHRSCARTQDDCGIKFENKVRITVPCARQRRAFCIVKACFVELSDCEWLEHMGRQAEICIGIE